MDDDGSPDRLSFLDASVPRAFEVRLLALPQGHEAEILDNGWRDALVVVERGELDLECAGGGRLRLRSGDMLWLCGLEVRRLVQRGREPTLLSAVARRREGRSPHTREVAERRELDAVGPAPVIPPSAPPGAPPSP